MSGRKTGQQAQAAQTGQGPGADSGGLSGAALDRPRSEWSKREALEPHAEEHIRPRKTDVAGERPGRARGSRVPVGTRTQIAMRTLVEPPAGIPSGGYHGTLSAPTHSSGWLQNS